MTSPKFCESCGRGASPDARFCGACGRAFPAAAEPANEPEEPSAPRSAVGVRGEGDRGEGDRGEETVFELRSVAVQSFGVLLLCILTVGLVWLWLLLMRRRLRYRITTERIEVAEGLVTVTRRTTDLFRVQDLEVVQPLYLRMRGAGHLVIRSLDVDEPVLTLVAIPDVQTVHEKLRSLVASERRRQHVRVIEEGR